MSKNEYLWVGFFRDLFVWLENLCEDFDWWFEEIKYNYFSLDYAWIALIPTQHNKNLKYLIEWIYYRERELLDIKQYGKPEEKWFAYFDEQTLNRVKIYYNNLKYWWMPKYDLL